MLPTLEEYSRIIGLPITGRIPFTGLEKYPKSHDIAKFTHLRKDEIEKNMVTKGGLPKEDDFEDVFALNIDKFVDMNAIKIFLKGNPVPTLLGDTYYSIHLRNSYGKGMVTCCTPLLYKRYISHFPDTHEFLSHKEGLRWSQNIMTLTNTDIVWTNNYFGRMKTLDSCGDFPNVPLYWYKRSHRKEIKDWKKKGDLSPEPFERWTGSRVDELRMPCLTGTSIPPVNKHVAPFISPPTIEYLQVALKKMKKSRYHWNKKFEYSKAEKGMMEESYDELIKEKEDLLFLQDGWLIEKDATIAKYAREKKRKQEEEALTREANAWKSIIEKLERVKLNKKRTQDDMNTSH
ncbi:uncharacterized protein LOC131651343 [Vicia villosa]|uniref:uncharacterized protein LOC131651343 n=1 Tax=Vicia villosa TaxID=3911 RepID=UPI00273C073F|nr:uncharacterized protein LOC131651343 [Vicia villosa]